MDRNRMARRAGAEAERLRALGVPEHDLEAAAATAGRLAAAVAAGAGSPLEPRDPTAFQTLFEELARRLSR